MPLVRTLAHPRNTRRSAQCRVRARWKSVLLDQQPSLLTLRQRCYVFVRMIHRGMALSDSSGTCTRAFCPDRGSSDGVPKLSFFSMENGLGKYRCRIAPSVTRSRMSRCITIIDSYNSRAILRPGLEAALLTISESKLAPATHQGINNERAISDLRWEWRVQVSPRLTIAQQKARVVDSDIVFRFLSDSLD